MKTIRKISTFAGQLPEKFSQRKIPRLQLILAATIIGIIGIHFLISSHALTAQPTTFRATTIPLSATEIPNATRGQYAWNGITPDPSNWPDSDVYYRDQIQWKQLEPSPGVYNFSIIDQGLAAAQARGYKFGFRIMAFSPSFGNDLAPAWIPTDPANSLGMVQWNSSTFLAEWANLMTALGRKYDHDPRLGWLDMGGYGSYGEWHIFDQPGTAISRTNMQTVMRAVTDAFPDKPTLAMTTNTTFLTDAMALSPKVGVRMDCLGTQNGPNGSLIDQVPAALSRWKTAPVITEWCNGTLGQNVNEYALGDSQVANYHISLLSSGNFPTAYNNMNSSDQASFAHANKSSGYRYQIDNATIPAQIAQNTSFDLTSSWENVNVAPTYQPWITQFQLRNSTGQVSWSVNSSLDLRQLLPTNGTPLQIHDNFSLPLGVAAGTYTLAVRIIDPDGYLTPMNLANQGRASDGSYVLGTITVVGDTTPAPPTPLPLTPPLPPIRPAQQPTPLLPSVSLALKVTPPSPASWIVVAILLAPAHRPTPI